MLPRKINLTLDVPFEIAQQPHKNYYLRNVQIMSSNKITSAFTCKYMKEKLPVFKYIL